MPTLDDLSLPPALAHELWPRLRDFTFDDPEAPGTFIARLRRHTGWSEAFAGRAIDEYRRFAFLSVVAGHVVCPSQEVDEVWHLHLLFTRSYWHDFCRDALGRPLHHEPGRGTAADGQRFRSLYVQTLDSYRHWFGVEPPKDLWPDVASRFTDPHKVHIDPREYWLLPRGAIRYAAGTLCLLVALLSLVALAGGAQPLATSPFDLPGPAFLKLYLVLLLSSAALALAVRYTLRLPGGTPGAQAHDLDAYELAVLAGGPRRLTLAVVATLVQHRTLKAMPEVGCVRAVAALPPNAHPAERALLQLIPRDSVRSVARLARDLAPCAHEISQRLADLGLVASPEQAWTARVISAACMVPAIVVGAAKIVIGLGRHRPVEFLVALSFIALGGCIALVGVPVVRTRRGDAVLRTLRLNYGSLRRGWAAREGPDARWALAWAVAAFGASSLSGSPLNSVKEALEYAAPKHRNTDSSTCGGSSCSGGSSGCGGCST